MKRKYAALALCAILSISVLTGCGSDDQVNENTNTEIQESTNFTEQEEGETEKMNASETETDFVETIENDVPLKEIEVDENNPDYQAILETEIYNYKVIRSLEAAYESEAWAEYTNSGNILLSLDAQNLDESAKDTIMNLYHMRQELKQVKSVNETMLFIWGDDMPTAEEESDLVFTTESFDNSDFRPFLTPYLVDDQNAAKGNIIMVSGGEFVSRANDSEGYPAAHKFNELGYNVFLVQRRVAPYSSEDIFADFQRALRYVRYHQEDMGLGRTDVMVGMGWSGGAATLLGEVALFYGNVQPTIIDADYIPDEIDKVNADFDVAIPVYGASYNLEEDYNYNGLVTENENLPAFFISMGADDPIIKFEDAIALFNSVRDKVETEIHVFSQNAHGYGIGSSHTNSESWPDLADQFIQQSVMMRNDDSAQVATGIEFGKIPEKYTKVQSFSGYAGFGTADVTVAVNEAEDAYYIMYQAFGQDVMLAGLLYDDGTVNNRYDSTGGMFTASAGYIVQGIDSSKWEEVPADSRP